MIIKNKNIQEYIFTINENDRQKINTELKRFWSIYWFAI